MNTIERPTVVRHAKAAKTSVVAVIETASEMPARKVSEPTNDVAATDMRSAQAGAEVSPTNAAAQVSTPDPSPKVTSSKVTSPNTASATACKGVGCQCGASQRHGEDGNRDPPYKGTLHDRYLSVPDGPGPSSSDAVSKHLWAIASGVYPLLWQLVSPCGD